LPNSTTIRIESGPAGLPFSADATRAAQRLTIERQSAANRIGCGFRPGMHCPETDFAASGRNDTQRGDAVR